MPRSAGPLLTAVLLGAGTAFAADAVFDLDGNSKVGYGDFFLFADCFGHAIGPVPDCAAADFDADGKVGYDDFFLFADNFGEHTDTGAPPGAGYDFDGAPSAEVLDAFLSRAVSHATLYTDGDDELLADDVRMFVDIGAKFIGRASIMWSTPADVEAHFAEAAAIAGQVHTADPQIILQGGIFEIVDTDAAAVAVPEWVFTAFGLPPEERTFRYTDMTYTDGRHLDYWGAGASVPDISQVETRLWFYYRARRYIDSGYEALHMGVVDLYTENDPGYAHLWDVVQKMRAYAGGHARRGWILCDAHHPTGVVAEAGHVFDFVSYPLRVQEVPGEPIRGQLLLEQDDVIYGRTVGGLTPAGWEAERLPYLVEVDNWASSGRGGEDIGGIWIWGWDEMSWFARLSKDERDEWLAYAWNWVREHDPVGYFQFPTRRILSDPIDDTYWWYFANNPSPSCELGLGQEDAIRQIWAAEE